MIYIRACSDVVKAASMGVVCTENLDFYKVPLPIARSLAFMGVAREAEGPCPQSSIGCFLREKTGFVGTYGLLNSIK